MLSFFVIILRKMIKNKWLVLTLLAGMIIGTALLSCIPAYTNAILQKMLLKEIQNYQKDNGIYPGGLYTMVETGGFNIKSGKTALDMIERYNAKVIDIMPLPLITESKLITTNNFSLHIPKEKSEKGYKLNSFNLGAYYGMEDHVKLVDGHMPAVSQTNNIYEAVVTEEALNRLDLIVGKEYEIEPASPLQKIEPTKIRITGVFEPSSENDPYWFKDMSNHKNYVLMNFDLMISDFVMKEMMPTSQMEWYCCFDYNFVKLGSIDRVLAPVRGETHGYDKLSKNPIDYKFPVEGIAEKFFEKRQQITTEMLSINISILVMLGLFLLMVSLLKIEREKTEISVLMSRGAGKLQVTFTYVAEGFILALCSMTVGPPLGLFLSRIIGASNGFLQFVDRTSIDAVLGNTSYFYACLGAFFSIFVLAAPAYISSGTSVIVRKQNIARRVKKPFWQKIFLDIILFAISGYAYFIFERRQHNLLATGLTAKSLEIDPLLFVAPAVFIIAVGLFFLRVFPLLVSLVYKAGKRFFTPAVYAVLLQASRSAAQYHFLMLFIIFTVALGLFSADTARTLNLNAEEKIRYSIAADVVIQPLWQRQLEISDPSAARSADTDSPARKGRYIEPDFRSYQTLKSVETATKVYSTNECRFVIKEKDFNTRLMAVNTEEFGGICWFRPDLLPHHWFEYLNLIAQEPSSVLISKSLAKAAGLKTGDVITISWGDSGYAPVCVFGIIDYWPSWNPNAKISSVDQEGEEKTGYNPDPMLIVGNFGYIQDNMSIEPYEIWLKLKPDAKTADLYDDIKERQLGVTNLTNMKDALVALKNDPLQLGVNGALTLGFIISVSVCLIGFILYWTLSIRARELQFGIFRAIGIQMRHIISMLAWEQALTSGIAILAGVLTGRLTSGLYIPFFQLSYSSYEQVPPFRIIYSIDDHLKLYILVGVMLIAGLAFLWSLVSRIKTAQALKLGED